VLYERGIAMLIAQIADSHRVTVGRIADWGQIGTDGSPERTIIRLNALDPHPNVVIHH
jgi:hypothetical protein